MADDKYAEYIQAAISRATGIVGTELLAEVKSLVPLHGPMHRPTAAFAAEAAARNAVRQERAQAAVAEAFAEWEQLRARAASPIVSAVLALHRPATGYEHAECAECCESGWDGADPVSWPCNTYTAIKEHTP